MKNTLAEMVERLRVDLLDVNKAIERDDVDAAIEGFARIAARIDNTIADLRKP